MKKSKKVKITLKQKMFLKCYFAGGVYKDKEFEPFNGTYSALVSYGTDDYDTASVIASENLAKLKNKLTMMMEMKGITLNKLMGVLNDGLESNKTISAIGDANGKSTNFVDVPDHAVRHKYLETASKWLGVKNSEEVKNQTNIQVNIPTFNVMSSETRDELKKIYEGSDKADS